MGVRVIVGKDDGGEGQDVAVFYDSTTGWAFGPVFGGIPDGDLDEGKDEAEAFLTYLHEGWGEYFRLWDDSRLEDVYGQWAIDNGAPQAASPEIIEDATGQGRR